jgi:glycosyltransferase involved in cell wall biosynthesis
MAALAHGVPIVSTLPAKPSAELIDGENIILVPPGDPSALADAVETVADGNELRTRLSKGASRLALQFTWEQIASETLRVYEELGV